MEYVRSFPVRDAKGDELTVYEYHEHRFIRRRLRLKLCTGELVEPNGADGFVIIATGERLTRAS
ncbi:MAG: hypothetical protein ABIW16_03325 [Sphingomicrobium sp.]